MTHRNAAIERIVTDNGACYRAGIPRSLIPDLRAHLDKYTENKPNALVFRGMTRLPPQPRGRFRCTAPGGLGY
jgi:hypothetical protein